MALLGLLAATVPMAVQARCVWSDLVRDEAVAAIVQAAAPRTYFVVDAALKPGCPNEGAACRDRAYLTPGDIVLSGPVQGGYTCAGFVGPKGASTVGFLPSATLARLKDADQRPTDWAGHWIAPEQDLTIAAAGGDLLSVQGDATWGGSDPDLRNRGIVHTGTVSGKARPVNGVLAFAMGKGDTTLPYTAGDEFTCRIRMLRRGPYLVVRGNMACGGANVSFSGFYRREG